MSDTANAALVGAAIALALVAFGVGPPFDLLAGVSFAALGLASGAVGRRSIWPREWKPWAAALLLYGGVTVLHARDPSEAALAAAPCVLAIFISHAAARDHAPAIAWWLGASLTSVVLAIAGYLTTFPIAWPVRAVLFAVLAVTGIGALKDRHAAWLIAPALAALAAGAAAVEAGAALPSVLSTVRDAWEPARCADAGACAEWLAQFLNGGAAPVFALALLLAAPAVSFAKGQRHPDLTTRRLAATGLVLVGLTTLGALTWPVFTAGTLLWCYAGGVSILLGLCHAAERAWYRRPVQRAQRLSAAIICMDEADRIEPCLESLAGWVDEIVVLDSGSTDGTVEIVRRYTDRVEVTDWPGFGAQKQKALARTTGDWVLSIDADEVVTPELKHDIDAALAGEPQAVGYRIPWAVVAYGRRLDFGRSARAPLRLFRRAGARFTDDVVHEKVILPPGPVHTLNGRLLHYSLRDYRHALAKSARYALLGAERKRRRGRWGGGLALATLRATWVFLQIYVLRLGFLDGAVGYLVAMTFAQGSFNKYAALWTMRRQARADGTPLTVASSRDADVPGGDARD